MCKLLSVIFKFFNKNVDFCSCLFKILKLNDVDVLKIVLLGLNVILVFVFLVLFFFIKLEDGELLFLKFWWYILLFWWILILSYLFNVFIIEVLILWRLFEVL